MKRSLLLSTLVVTLIVSTAWADVQVHKGTASVSNVTDFPPVTATVDWDAPFPDLNYVPVCSLTALNGGTAWPVVMSKSTSGVTVAAVGTVGQLGIMWNFVINCIGVQSGTSDAGFLTGSSPSLALTPTDPPTTVPLTIPWSQASNGQYTPVCDVFSGDSRTTSNFYGIVLINSQSASAINVSLRPISDTTETFNYEVDCIGVPNSSQFVLGMTEASHAAVAVAGDSQSSVTLEWNAPFSSNLYTAVCSPTSPDTSQVVQVGTMVTATTSNSVTVEFDDRESSAEEIGANCIAIGSTIVQQLSVLTTSLPNGILSQSYSQTLAATGGTGTYTSWSIVSGTLPDGLALDSTSGTISGTPTKPGTFPFSVVVMDSSGLTSDPQTLSITISSSFSVFISQGQPLSINPSTINAVANREMLVRIGLKLPLTIDPTTVIPIEVQFENNTYQLTPTASMLFAHIFNGLFSEDFFVTPSLTGGEQLVVTVDPGHVTGVDFGSPNTTNLNVVQVRQVNLAYYSITYLGQLTDFGTSVSDSQTYLKAIYPVANLASVTGTYVPISLSASSIPLLGARIDAQGLWLQGKLGTSAERIIGVAPAFYFSEHFPFLGTSGVSYPSVKGAVIVKEGFPSAVAHELGHTYGMYVKTELYDTGDCNDINTLDGLVFNAYWLERRQVVSQSQNYMCGTPDQSGLTTSQWTTTKDFATLMGVFQGKAPDPEVLLVTGFVNQDGTANFQSMYCRLADTASASESGDASVRVLDLRGNVLSTLTFPVDFNVFTDPRTTTTSAPFAFSLPYPANAAQVQITRAGALLFRVNIASKLLSDAIRSIPDYGFVRNQSQLRNALLLNVNAMDLQLSAGNTGGAAQLLQNEIRTQLVNWLIDGYTTQTPLEYTKQQILDLVDELVGRLEG
jgi:Putative Ig domain